MGNIQDIGRVLFLVLVIVGASLLTDWEGTMEQFDAVKEALGKLAKEINKI